MTLSREYPGAGTMAGRSPPADPVYTVSRLNREVRELLEGSFPPLWVEGEVSNLARPASGHLYFTLKDAQAQVRCVMFRSQHRGLTAALRDGQQVRLRATLGLYEGRGDYQLIVSHIEEAGEGALRRAFELLHRRLSAEGLFDPARKKPLPRLPRRLGVITSPSGAALRDILTTLRRRFPAIAVLVIPVPVQGTEAAPRIVAALRAASARRDCDALILARGGGSLEDLWPFNEEAVVRAVAACPLPLVSGVGHETDVTLADLAADARAPTPTAAAEMLSPDQNEWLAGLSQKELRLGRLVRTRLATAIQHIDHLGARLVHPQQRLGRTAERIGALAVRLRLALGETRSTLSVRFGAIDARLRRAAPAARVRERLLELQHRRSRLGAAARQILTLRRERLAGTAEVLGTLNPLATLARGYAIATRPGGVILRDAAVLRPGDPVHVRLARGRLTARVDAAETDG